MEWKANRQVAEAAQEFVKFFDFNVEDLNIKFSMDEFMNNATEHLIKFYRDRLEKMVDIELWRSSYLGDLAEKGEAGLAEYLREYGTKDQAGLTPAKCLEESQAALKRAQEYMAQFQVVHDIWMKAHDGVTGSATNSV